MTRPDQAVQLIREAIAILDDSEPLDVRDWLRTARAYLETLKTPMEPSCEPRSLR